jgi:hypothetical protein
MGNFTEEKVIRNLIHGRQWKIAMNARKKKSQDPIDKDSADQLPDRIAELERRMLKVENDVALLKSLNPSPLLDEVVIEVEREKRGTKEKISAAALFNYRDGLILWLECAWPWLKDRLFKAKTPTQVKVILEAIADEPDSRPDWQERLLKNESELFDFIWHHKFRKSDLRSATVTDALTLPCNDETRRRAANKFPTRQIANGYGRRSRYQLEQITRSVQRQSFDDVLFPDHGDVLPRDERHANARRAGPHRTAGACAETPPANFARSSNRSELISNRAIKPSGGGNGSTAAGRGRGR